MDLIGKRKRLSKLVRGGHHAFGITFTTIQIFMHLKDVDQLRPLLYGEKLSRVEGSPAYPSYPGRANFSYISLQNLANRLHEKQKVGSARRVTRLAGLPFCDGRVTLLAGPTFLHINTLARLAGSTRSRRDDQSMRELCCYWKVSSWLGQRGQLFSHINTW